MRRMRFRPLMLLAAALLALALGAGVQSAGACAGPCSVADYDGDGINDWADNCPLRANLSQRDTDNDTPPAIVDVGAIQGVPNNPVVSTDGAARVYPQTPYQTGQLLPTDMPPDKGGDACDDDDDADGIKDRQKNGNPPDNCPVTPNPNQADADGDGVGDVCDDTPAPATATATAASAPAPAAPAGPSQIRAKVPRSLRFDEISLGISVPVRCTARCQVAGELVLDRRAARRAQLPKGSLVIGRGSAFLEGRGTTFLFVRVPAKSVKRLASSFGRLRPLLRVTTSGKRVTTRRVTLHR
jgi:hypothetical protein